MSGKRRSLAELASATRVATSSRVATSQAADVAAEPATATEPATEPTETTPPATATPPAATATERPLAAASGQPPAPRGQTRGRRSAAKRPLRYDELERKETRLRADQYEALTTLSRHLNRRRAGRGQRITENTLIRVAVDMLLANPSLAGVTEDELRQSVTS